MASRFSMRRVAGPDIVPAAEESVLDQVAWTVHPEAAAEPAEPAAPAAANPLVTDKLLDAKVRLHRRLIEEINLSALEKLPEEEIRGHIQQLVAQYVLVERLALNTQELNDFVSAVGRRVDEAHPMCDARLLDGSRVNVAVRPVAIDGPLMSIRKFSKKPFNLNKLIDV